LTATKLNYLSFVSLAGLGFSLYGLITLNLIYFIAGIMPLVMHFILSDILKIDDEIFTITTSKNLWLLTIFIIVWSLLSLVSKSLGGAMTYIILNDNVYSAVESRDTYYLDTYDELFNKRIKGGVIHITRHLGKLEDLILNPNKEYNKRLEMQRQYSDSRLEKLDKNCKDWSSENLTVTGLESCDYYMSTLFNDAYDVIYFHKDEIWNGEFVNKLLPKSNPKVHKILKEIFKEEPNNFRPKSFEIYKNGRIINSGDGLKIQGSGARFLSFYFGDINQQYESPPRTVEQTTFEDYLK